MKIHRVTSKLVTLTDAVAVVTRALRKTTIAPTLRLHKHVEAIIAVYPQFTGKVCCYPAVCCHCAWRNPKTARLDGLLLTDQTIIQIIILNHNQQK